MNSSKNVKLGVFEIEGYLVNPSKNIVQFQGKELPITPKMLAVLRVLVENQGQTVSKEVLLNSVWGTTITTDMVLSRAISDLRKLFDDSARKQEFISTISKQGYCLNKQVIWNCQQRKSHSNKVFASILALSLSIFLILISQVDTKDDSAFSLALLSAPRLKNITADKIDQRYARFSHDGEKLAYLEKANHNLKVIVRELNDDKTITVKEYIDRSDILAVNFAFSADGSQLAIKQLNSNNCSISIVQLSNLEEKMLNVCPESPIASIDWFPNSSDLLVTNYDKDTQIVGLSKINIDSEHISHFKIEHNEPFGLLFPRISESGQSILLVSIEPRSDLWGVATYDLRSGVLKFVLKTEHKINQAVWHQPGESIFYVVESGGQPGVWYYNLIDKTRKHIHTIDRNIRDLDFSFRNNQFAYIQEEFNLDIWQISSDSEGNIIDKPLGLASSQNSNPKLSPNEKHLALFSSGRGQHELLIYDLQSKTVVLRYEKDHMKFVDISWSPDSRYLLLTASDEDRTRLFQIDSRTGNSTPIETSSGYNPFRGRWSTTNSNIYWSEQRDGKWQLVERDSNGNQRDLAVDLEQEYLFTPDGSVLYKEGGNYLSQNLIFSCRLEDNSCNSRNDKAGEEMIVSDRYLSGWDYKNETVFYTLFNTETLGYMMYRMPLATKQAHPMYSLEPEALARTTQLSISSDEKTLYYTKKQRISFDIILMEQTNT